MQGTIATPKQTTRPRGGQLRRPASFAAIGAGVALLGLAVLFVLVHDCHLAKNLAYFAQALVSIELNFVLNRRFTWGDRTASAGIATLAQHWIAFHTTKVGTIILNQALFTALLLAHTPYLVAYLLCVAICTAINYSANDRLVFRPAAG